MRKRAPLIIFLAILCLMSLGTSCWGGVKYLGESTWTISQTTDEEGPALGSGSMTGAITYMGGTYYTMQGCVILQDDGPLIFAGGGVLIGETLYLTLSLTQKHTSNGWRDTEILQFEVDKNTLNGTFFGVGHDFDLNSMGQNPDYDSRYSAGTLTLNGKFINLIPNTMIGASLLLLDE